MSIETKKAVLSHLMTNSHFSAKEITRLMTSFDRPPAAATEKGTSDHMPAQKCEE